MTPRARTGVVVRAHTSTYPDPVHFEPGERLKLGAEDDEFPGWIWVVLKDGNEGWAPLQYIGKHHDGAGESTASYTARELDTTAGQRLTVHDSLNQWLWVETENGELGWVPASTVQLDQ